MYEKIFLIVIITLYLFIVITVGFLIGRKVKTASDYAIAGKSLPGWAAALSERATGESCWALLGLPGAAYAIGLTELWTAIGCTLGILISWIFIANKIQEQAKIYEANTFMDLISKRYGKPGQIIQTIGSLIIAFFFFFYIGAQFIGGGKTMNQIFQIDIISSIIMISIFVLPYTIYGGFKSVVYTDVIQAIIMITTLIVTPIIGIYYIHNNTDVYATNIYEALKYSGPQYTSLTGLAKGFNAGIAIISGFSWLFGYLGGMPQLTTRFMAIKDKKQTKQARNIGIIWTLTAYTGALIIGWLGLAIFGPNHFIDREAIMPAVIMKLFNPFIGTILLTGVFAAIISTANSLLILASTEISEILIKTKLNLLNSLSNLNISRIITTIISLSALIFALTTTEHLVYNIVKYVWAGIGDTFSVIMLLTIFWKRYHAKAVMWTMIVGMTFTIIWIQTPYEKYISCLILTFLVALLTAIITTFLIKNYSYKTQTKTL
ncbi:MAG TPA: sodium/proline symporter [Bacteroidales bacterium]|nr:sodium/proline symporter [Bacteroidales bacterium]